MNANDAALAVLSVQEFWPYAEAAGATPQEALEVLSENLFPFMYVRRRFLQDSHSSAMMVCRFQKIVDKRQIVIGTLGPAVLTSGREDERADRDFVVNWLSALVEQRQNRLGQVQPPTFTLMAWQ